MGVDRADCQLVAFEGLDDLLARDVDHSNGGVIGGGEDLAVVLDEAELPHEFGVRLEAEDFVFVALSVDDVDVAVVVAGSDEALLTGFGEGCEEDLPYFSLLDPFLGGAVVEVDAAVVTSSDYGVVDALNFPVLHDLALDGADFDWMEDCVHSWRS